MNQTPHPTDVRVGRLLRERRVELGISQERLGGMLGVTYQQVQKYERGANRIGSSRLHELCGILGVRSNYFFEDPSQGGLAEEPAAFVHASAPTFGSAEGRLLLDAFARIADADVRRRILELTQALARLVPSADGRNT